jgi:hypothetical protein
MGAAIWLCPFWLTPTPSVPSLLWGGALLGLWLVLDTYSATPKDSTRPIRKLFWLLLASLAGMIAWRSRELQNTLAAALCLASIGFAASLSAKADQNKMANILAWGWLMAGLANAALGLAQYFAQTAEPLGTAFGFLRQRNHLSTLSNIALLSLLYLWLQRQAKPSTTRFSDHFFAGFACAVLTAALAATCSRAGLLELTISIAFMLTYALAKRHCKLLLAVVLAITCYAMWAYALPLLSGSTETIFGRIAQTTATTHGSESLELQDSRRLLWGNTLTLIQSQPLLGVGWRELALSLRVANFEIATRFAEQADNAHNLPLQLAAELGVPFTALWFSLLAWLVVQSKPWQTRLPAQLLAWGVMLVIGIHSLVEYPMWYAPFQIALGLSAGLVFVQPVQHQAAITTTLRNPVSSPIWHGFAGIGLICFCTYAAFDYHRVRQLFIAENDRASLYRNGTFGKAEASWLFAAQVRFAKLITTPVTPENAEQMRILGREVLHFSPEPLVFKVLLEADRAPLK